MTSGPKITRERLEALKRRLASLPPRSPDAFTRQEAIVELAPYIRRMQARNYRLEDLLPILNEGDGGFTVASLKTYLSRVPKAGPEAVKAPKAPPRGVGAGDAGRGVGVSPDVSPEVSPEVSPVVHDGSRLRAPPPSGDVL